MDLAKTVKGIYSKLGKIQGLGGVATFNGATTTGIFSTESVELGFTDKGEPVLAHKKTFQFATSDLPGIKIKDTLNINGSNYKVRDKAIQDYGLTTILYLMDV